MLDLALFRRPAFTGASIVAFTLSSSFFAMFLYLTLYIQDVLGYSPLQAGLRFLPIDAAVVHRGADRGALSVRVPVRLLLGSGLMLIGIGLMAMTGVDASLDLDRADSRLPARRRGRRPGQPAAGLDRDRGGARSSAAAWPRGSTRPSARSASPRGSPAWAPSSSTASPAGTTAALAAGGQAPPGRDRRPRPALSTLLESGEVAHIARSLSAAARAALDHSYRVGFTEAFTTIAAIAAAVALAGAVLAFVLVRSRDFVSAGELPAAQAAGARARRERRRLTREAALGNARRLMARPLNAPAAHGDLGSHGFRSSCPRQLEHRQARVARIGWILRASGCTARTSSRGCCAPAAGARRCRTAPPAGARGDWAVPGSSVRTSTRA